MDIFAYSMIGLGLAMDAAAGSMCKGLAVCQVKPKHCFIAGAYFGIFQGVMPAIGYALGRTFSTLIADYAFWVSFALLVLGGIALVTYYMSFGIYYDEDSLIYSSLGKASVTYYFKNIRSQQLYLASGNVVVELHMEDGNHFQVHTGMTGMYAFMDHAFQAWLQQTGRKQEDCPFHDPQNSCWFPPMEEK